MMTTITENAIGKPAEELDFTHLCIDESDRYFTEVIGCIEDIIMDKKFLELHTNFMDKYWTEFDTSDENKLIYTEIFQKYNETIEKYIEEHLIKAFNGFKMDDFEKELQKRANELDGEIFEILSTFTDFMSFKNMFLDYRTMKEGKAVDFSKDVYISKCFPRTDGEY